MNALRPALQVLLVEDSASDALFIEEALADVQDFEACPTRAEWLSHAIEHAQTAPCDVVLLDLGLPDSQGPDTFRRFHRQVPSVPVLVLTGLDDILIGLQAIQEGAQDYLLKRDIEVSLLGRAIRYAIERHRVAAELVASKERFQLAVNGASAGLWDWDLGTDLVYFSPHFKEIMDYHDDEPADENHALLDAIHPDDIERVRAALAAHLEQRSPYDVEYRVNFRSGTSRWIESRGQALWNGAGQPYRMVGWIMDVTDRKRDEEALRISREELRRLSAHIQHVREEEKARIARELHDDLGQQLTALKMGLAEIEIRLKGQAAATQTVRDRLSDMSRLIDMTVASVRRIAADLRPVMLDDLGLMPAIDWLVNDFTDRYGIDVERRIDPGDTTFTGIGATTLFRIVQEALTNVARHANATAVVLTLCIEGGCCMLRVADNGRGGRIVDGGGSDRQDQSFGLVGIRERAHMIGGSVTIDTADGKGFSITVTFPLHAVQQQEVLP
ncbi:histidine kinase [Burkholderia ubonensis]|uniref:hybrid sensor histidine kinase/response regulator n=1 Tax=Burkholderia TaxID=32008 RepID=UPI0005ACA47E|nr:MULTISPECIES: PAS domain-containing protein [Burkholderia]KIP17353.1 response regulator [Burkholderia sp. MSHR3999]KVD16078.1 histidine kinase [Burkholderia ubonensis]KVU24946.1 histidine kinase [Burkholderia ubonensis]